jgi:stage V sporulation protein SpoVS
MVDKRFRAVPMLAPGCAALKGDEVTGNIKVPQPARRRRGVTLIEAVLYIAVSLALIVGGLVFYQQASMASRVNRLAGTMTSLISEARALAVQTSGLGFVPGTLETVLITQGSVPASALDVTRPVGQRIRHPWDSNVLLDFFDLGGDTAVTLRMNSIPVEACTRLAWVDGAGRGMFATRMTGVAVSDDPITGMATSVSIFPDDRSGAVCRSRDLDGNGRVNTFMWFRLGD